MFDREMRDCDILVNSIFEKRRDKLGLEEKDWQHIVTECKGQSQNEWSAIGQHASRAWSSDSDGLYLSGFWI